ncbi:MAG: hypothetical protein COA57_02015 [Flavobacteriales bacterium]|nr:MAG: hypothetical protein COA57_02015 [Flavobacteriales bacterium]
MKTKTILKAIPAILIIAAIATTHVFAQGNTWKLNGNNNVGASDFIGTKNNEDLRLKTNNQSRMTITKDGNVCIGTNNTGEKFEVVGTARITEQLKIGTNTLILGVTGPTGPPNNIYTTDADLLINSNPSFNFNTILNANGSTGKIGIGTASPVTKVHINDNNANSVFTRYTNLNSQNGFETGIGPLGGGMIRHNDNSPIQIQTFNNPVQLHILPDDRIAAFRNTSGNIINPTNNPAKFEVNDRNPDFPNIETTTLFRARGRGFDTGNDPQGIANNFTLADFIQSRTHFADAGIRIQGSRANCIRCDVAFIDFANSDLDDSPNIHLMSRIAAGIGGLSNIGGTTRQRGYLKMYTNAGNRAGLVERMRIRSNGDVGIGDFSTLGPNANDTITHRLDVDGNVRIRELPVNTTLTAAVVANSDGCLFINPNLGGGGGTDRDWLVATPPFTDPPTNIDDNIFTLGNVGIGINTPSTKLQVHEAGSLFGLSTSAFLLTNAVTGQGVNDGFSITQSDNNSFLINFEPTGNMIFNTGNADERMRIFSSTFAQPGMVRIGINNGIGPVLGNPRLLVSGSRTGFFPLPTANYIVAEFRNEFGRGSSTGISIRGSRNLLTDHCTAFLDFSNFDDNEGSGGTEFVAGRISGDMQQSAGQTGFMRFFTNEGNNLTSKMVIDRFGYTGIGTVFNVNTLPKRRLDVFDPDPVPQFRITQTFNNVFTDFRTTALGDLVIEPFNNTVPRFVGIHTNTPGNTLEINSGVTGESGLTFTQLDNTITPDPNPSTGVLSLDDSGTVIWVEDAGGAGLHCWDLNGDGIKDPAEDVNNDAVWNALDCQGIDGAQGPTGPTGTGGADLDWNFDGTNVFTAYPNTDGFPTETANVGIGNNNPQDKVHISTDAPGAVRITDMSNNLRAAIGRDVLGEGVLKLWDNTIVLAPRVVLSTTGSSFIDGNSAMLGIGNDSPLDKIHISTDAPGAVRITDMSDKLRAAIGRDISGEGVLKLWDNITASPKVVITTSGSSFIGGVSAKLGIGNTSPLDKIHISTDAPGAVRITDMNNKLRAAIGRDVSGEGALKLWDNTAAIQVVLRTAGVSYINGGNVGIGTTTPLERLHVIGNIFASGTITELSDQRFKKDIKQLENALDNVLQLRGVNYYMNTERFYEYNLSDKKQIGFIAQEVEKVLPELVVTHEDGYKSLDYMKMTPILVEAIKEQQQIMKNQEEEIEKQKEKLTDQTRKNEETKEELNTMKAELEELKTALEAYGLDIQTTKVKLEGEKQTIILNQNDPNPFKEKTTIKYFIPNNVQNGRIVIFDNTGRLIKEVNIEKGFGELDVYASNLSTGIYTYSIIADEKVVDSKKMILAK